VCPKFEWQNFTLEEHNTVVKAKRSNNLLDTSKLEREFPNVPDIKTAMRAVMVRMREIHGEIEPPTKI
jgi:3,5-epimerase/4-reductase